MRRPRLRLQPPLDVQRSRVCLFVHAAHGACSFHYFDRLILKNVVNKGNRRAVAGAAPLPPALGNAQRDACAAGACLLISIKISDDFFVGSRIFHAAANATHDDAKRVCQISNTMRVTQEPFYEIVTPSRFYCRACSSRILMRRTHASSRRSPSARSVTPYAASNAQ